VADKLPIIDLRTSPHLRDAPSVPVIMRNVVYAMLPICAYAVYQFGLSALALILVTTVTCVLTESLFNRGTGKADTVGDYSAMVTGMLLALTLPPGFPLWMAAVAAFVGISLGKVFFGGLGFNVMNPALIGRAFVQAAFPVAITTWTPAWLPQRFTEFIPSTLTPPLMEPAAIGEWLKQAGSDGFTGATPLALWKFEQVSTSNIDLFTGMTAGSAGETSALLILVCGAYLALRRMMDWRIPLSMLGMAFLTGGLFYLLDANTYPDPVFILFSGGLMLGAMFMASDMVASPVTPLGIWIYGAFMGFITVIIRLFGGLPEGVMYAILLGNAVSPLIDSLTQPRVYGTGRKSHES
jgi:electron transport complex protein RnfD